MHAATTLVPLISLPEPNLRNFHVGFMPVQRQPENMEDVAREEGAFS
jgi:hypothetical protein